MNLTTVKKTKLKSTLIIASLLILFVLVSVISLSLALPPIQQAEAAINYLELDYQGGVIDDSYLSSFLVKSEAQRQALAASDGIVDTKQEFCAIFFSGLESRTYTLKRNFCIVASNWYNNSPTIPTGTIIIADDVASNKGKTATGKAVVLNTAKDITETDGVAKANYATKGVVGGFAAVNKGLVKDLTYVFMGAIYAESKKPAGAEAYTITAGGMIGTNEGILNSCTVECASDVTTIANHSDSISYVGGIIGLNRGEVNNCNFIFSGSVSAYTDSQERDKCKNSIVYSGGIVGYLSAGGLNGCKVKAQGSVTSFDNTKMWTDWGSIIDLESPLKYNDKQYVHPAGGVVGFATGASYVTSCKMEIGGSVSSQSVSGSSNQGAVAGGFIGMLGDASAVTISGNALTLQASLSAMYSPTISLDLSTDTVLSLINTYGRTTPDVYAGEFLGKAGVSGAVLASTSIINNLIYISGEDEILEVGMDLESDAEANPHIGLICGSNFNSLGVNNWLVRNLSKCKTSKLFNNVNNDSQLNHMSIFGSGGVEGEAVSGGIKLKAVPSESPFYGWTDDIGDGNNIDSNIEKIYTNSSGQVTFAMFIDTDIRSAGELTQFAYDINLIKEDVWAHLNVPNEDNTMYFNIAKVPTLYWLKTSLGADITVESGVPVIEDFYGTFDGNSHTIKFASGAKIAHDYEQKKDTNDSDIATAVYNERNTGLFGMIKSSGTVKNLNILFGGAISEEDGLKYDTIDGAGDKMASLKAVNESANSNTVKSRTFDFSSFVLPTDLDVTKCYSYYLTGDGYVRDRANNPGYVDIYAYDYEIIVDKHYVGVLAGANYGTITNVNVEVTTSGYVSAKAKSVYFGVICGKNAGQVNNVNAVHRGKANLTSVNSIRAGGAFGTTLPGYNTTYNGINVFITGEINIKTGAKYHKVIINKYDHATAVNTSLPSGYDKIAYDFRYSNNGQNGTTIGTTYIFGVKDLLATETYIISGNDIIEISQSVGGFTGYYNNANGVATIQNSVVSCTDESVFNTPTINCDDTAKVGNLIGEVFMEEEAITAAEPVLKNVWSVLNDSQRNGGRVLVGNDNNGGANANRVYVQDGIAIATISVGATKPISFVIEAKEGKTFSGWYDYTSGRRQVVTNGIVESIFIPQKQSESDHSQLYIAELVDTTIMSQETLDKIAASTNEGRGYKGVEFMLGSDLSLNSNFVAIGTESAPFEGTFDGRGNLVTINGFKSGQDVLGLFGCVGTDGLVKNVQVKIATSIGNQTVKAVGAIAAVNNGVLGQDSSTAKVKAFVEGGLTANNAGGLVGINNGILKNGEVTLEEGSFIKANIKGATACYAGGAVGKNSGLAKNLIVYYPDDESDYVSALTTNYAIGGIVGYNDVDGKVYSSVTNCNYLTITNENLGTTSATGKNRGLLIGNNASEDIDALWVLYLNKNLGGEIPVYSGNGNENVTDKAVLINGINANNANMLVKYGVGNISVSISGSANDTYIKGGEISFASAKVAGGDDFYDYLSNFNNGERVSVKDGNAGFAFVPTITTTETVGLTGKVYYAGFAKGSIASGADIEKLALLVNSGYKLYVDYTVTNDFVYNTDNYSTILGATSTNPFIGSLNGNGYTITIKGNTKIHPIFGYVGVNDGNNYAQIKSLKVIVQASAHLVNNNSNDESGLGFIAKQNNGTISALTMEVRSVVKNNYGGAGVIAGVNNGVIESASVNISFHFTSQTVGAVYAKQAGALVGMNNGTIGSDKEYAIDLTIGAGSNDATTDGKFGGIVYGTDYAGVVAGVNGVNGKVYSTLVNIKGVLGGATVGGAVGLNNGEVAEASVTIEKSARVFGTTSFGGVVGENVGKIGKNTEDLENGATFDHSIFSYILAGAYAGASLTLIDSLGLTTGAVTNPCYGGIAGKNMSAATIGTAYISIRASISAISYLGGIAGVNEGLIAYSKAESFASAAITANYVGGVAGSSSNIIDTTYAIMKGNIGTNSVTYAGGITGKTTAKITNSIATIYGNIAGINAGLVAGEAGAELGENVWAQVSNACALSASVTADTGFNVLRVLSDTLLEEKIDYAKNQISFTSINKAYKWYTNISNWKSENAILTENLSNNVLYRPRENVANADYAVSYDALEIKSAGAFTALANLINGNSYYRDVLFVLSTNITITSGDVAKPIGDDVHPFNAIFDGGYNTITFESGSVISGAEYCGLFGYIAENAIVRNFILNVNKGVILGGVKSEEVGTLAGHVEGSMSNVFLNVGVNPTYANGATNVGSFAGYINPAKPGMNCWISILNGNVAIVGNADGENFHGVNSLSILGDGETEVVFNDDYEFGTSEEVTVKYSVPKGEKGTQSYKDKCAGYFTAFGGWYSNISAGELITSENASIYGVITSDKTNKDIAISVNYGMQNKKITLSFINLLITDEATFARFASDVNTYGDQNAQFVLNNDITIDLSVCEAVGTQDKPFTGRFAGNGHTIFVKGNSVKRLYAGVFGLVGNGGQISNLMIDVIGENVKFGDNGTIYSGVCSAYLDGTITNVVVRLRADTIVYTAQGEKASGGLVGRVDSHYDIVNSWLVLAENCMVKNAVALGDYYDNSKTEGTSEHILQCVGVGTLEVTIDATNGTVRFDATEVLPDGREGFYGFIDNNEDGDSAEPINDGGAIEIKTVAVDNTITSHMLAVFIDKSIDSYDDLVRLATNVSLGRNFRGITYEQSANITIPVGVYNPIGGVFVTSTSGATQDYVERDFIGGYNGNGYNITMPEGVVVGARYAGLFGRTGATARIKNLTIETNAELGVETGDNTTCTLYAGVLAAYAQGGKFENIVIVINKLTTLYGSMGVGRAFGYLPYSAGNVTDNTWVVSYNSKVNYDFNAQEKAYNNNFVSADDYDEIGSNQGGVNNLMVVAAGEVNVIRDSATTFHFVRSGDDWHWYLLNEFTSEQKVDTDSYVPNKLDKRIGYNVSFLNSEIHTLADLENYADNINSGYNFYMLTFTLEADITIDNESDFKPIGNATCGVNGTFDGQGHTIALARNATIGGNYAGIFGVIGTEGVVQNVKIVVEGTLGENEYTLEQVNAGKVNTTYAGAIAYNAGQIKNVVVVAKNLTFKTLNGSEGLVIGYDATNLVSNVWGLVDASSYLEIVGGVVDDNKTGVNELKIIGVGNVVASLSFVSASAGYKVAFDNDFANTQVPVLGWYKDYETSLQISADMLDGGVLTNGENGGIIMSQKAFGVKYEVAVIKTLIETADELIAIAEDVNVGGYTFENLMFTLGKNIDLPNNSGKYVSIGTEEHQFKGEFSGKYGANYYTITVRSGYTIGGIFGVNAGTIKDLTVMIEGVVGSQTASESDHIYGAIANVNNGTISSCYVHVKSKGKVVGYSVGAIAGANNSLVTDCVVIVDNGASILSLASDKANIVNIGGLVGMNQGIVEGTSDWSDWEARNILPESAHGNIFINGTIKAERNAENGSANAGGVVGNNSGLVNTNIRYVIAYLNKDGVIEARANTKLNANAGGLVGYSSSAITSNALFVKGSVLSDGYFGGTAGYLKGVTVMNTWQILYNSNLQSVGSSAKSVNTLNIKGSGEVKVTIDTNTNTMMFTNITDSEGSKIDGWYIDASTEVNSAIGNVGENGNTLLVNNNINNKTIMVIYVNTSIKTVDDLISMASSLSSGLSDTSIEFTLDNDITIDKALYETIGNIRYPFNNIFNGNGYKITVQNDMLSGGEYYGLFGYVGAHGVIKNLVIEVEGKVGGADSAYTSVIAANNAGKISNCTVTIKDGAVIEGNIVGAIAGNSEGIVENSTVNIIGAVSAVGGNSPIAGGAVGVNSGKVIGIALNISGEVKAGQVSMLYAGGIIGENFGTLSESEVMFTAGEIYTYEGNNAYSSAGVALNLGLVDRVYIEVSGGKLREYGTSAGIVANNTGAVTSSLIKLVDASIGGVDSVIATNNISSDNQSKFNNVWVFTNDINNISACASVNNAVYSSDSLLLNCPTKAEVKAGKIKFSTNAKSFVDRIAIFAEIDENGAYGAGSGAVVTNVSYEGSDIKYICYDEVSSVVTYRTVRGVRMYLTARKEFGSGSEFTAFGKAINSGYYIFGANTTFALTQDFALIGGEFEAIGTSANNLSSNITFNGNHHIVTIEDGTILNGGLFGYSDATINNIGLRLTKTEQNAYIVNNNAGVLNNAVVYIENNGSQTDKKFFVNGGSGNVVNNWIVTRRDVNALGFAANEIHTIQINGVGNVFATSKDATGMAFTANVNNEDMIFVGWTKDNTIIETKVLFDTANKEKKFYTAEFVSTKIDTAYKFEVLSGAVQLGFTGLDENNEPILFTLGADIELASALTGFSNHIFHGVIDGNGHTLVVNSTGELTLFGVFSGEVKNMVIDLTAGISLVNNANETYLGASFTNVVIIDNRSTFDLENKPITANNVYLQTNNVTLHDAFVTAPTAVMSKYSLIFSNSLNGISYFFDNGQIMARVNDSPTQVFAGWFGESENIKTLVLNSKENYLSKNAGNIYKANFISKVLASEDDLVRISLAVSGGFKFAGETFEVKEGFEINSDLATIGDATHEFKANIKGGVDEENSRIVFKRVQTASLFYNFIGKMSRVIFEYDYKGNKPSLINELTGTLSGVVVISDGATNGGAGVATTNSGVILNTWYVTKGTDRAVLNDETKSTNVMRVDDTNIDIVLTEELGGVKAEFTFNATEGNFVSLYDLSENENVIYPVNYDSAQCKYTSAIKAVNKTIKINSVHVVYNEDELAYLSYATAGGKLGANEKILLGCDITISGIKEISLDSLTLDGQGFKLIINRLVDNDNIFVGGTFKNMIVVMNKNYGILSTEGATLDNTVLWLKDSGINLPNYNVVNATILTTDKTGYNSVATASGAYKYAYYPQGADISVTFDATPIYIGSDNDKYYFAGIKTLVENEKVEAFYAPKQIANIADWNMLANANDVSADKLEGKVFNITNDFSTDDTFDALVGFNGTLIANHSITIIGGSYATGDILISAGEKGSITGVSLVLKDYTSLNAVAPMQGVTNSVIIAHRSGSNKYTTTADGVQVINVFGTGEVQTVFSENNKSFVAMSANEFELRKWTDATDAVVNEKDGYAVKTFATADNINAYFEARYLVTFNYVDYSNNELSAEMLGDHAGDLPILTTDKKLYWESELTGNIYVKVADRGNAFMFWGISAKNACATVKAVAGSLLKFEITKHNGVYDIVLNVKVERIESPWVSFDYDGTNKTVNESLFDNIKTRATTAGYSTQFSYVSVGGINGATPPMVNNKPYHAGTYLVIFKIYKGVDILCYAESGLVIKPVELAFETLTIKNKVYDGTTKAEVDAFTLSGFVGENDQACISFTGLTFEFVNAEAGDGKFVKVAGNAELAYNSANDDVDNSHKYTYLDYTFTSDTITAKTGGFVCANITRRNLKLSVDSISIDYMAQFNEDTKVALTPTRQTTGLSADEGLLAIDEAKYNEIVSTILTREDSDNFNVGNYRIIVANTLALANYNVVMTGSEAYYIVNPSEIKVIFDEINVTYGNKVGALAYHACVGGECEGGCTHVGMREGDTLVFDNVEINSGNELIPSADGYDMTCLFSASNKNYFVQVDSDGYKFYNGVACAVLKAEKIVKVSPREIKVTVDDAANQKVFGKRKDSINGALSANSTFAVKSHKLEVSRAAGEVCGKYALIFKVFDVKSVNNQVVKTDVTAYYNIVTEQEDGYFFTINPVDIRIKPSATSIIYGESANAIKYSVKIDDGSITLADLYYALKGYEATDKVTFATLGVNITVGLGGVPNVGVYDATCNYSFENDVIKNNIKSINMTNGTSMINVTQRYLTVTIADLTKIYDGTSNLNESKIKFTSAGILAGDKDKIQVKPIGYTIAGGGISVGSYRLSGTFEVVANKDKYSAVANNYFVKVVPATLTVNAVNVGIVAQVGYYDEAGTFTPASILRSTGEVENTIYYGDSKAILHFTLKSKVGFLNVPNGTDKEQSDYLVSTLKIAYNKLSKVIPSNVKKTIDELGLISANNNVKATFTGVVGVAPVSLILKVVTTTKTVGEKDPAIAYEIIAQDPYDDYVEIANYMDIAKESFEVTITGDRNKGESLGSYTYENISYDIVNILTGESLFDESSEIGKALNGNMSAENTEDVKLLIKSKNFLNTLVGKLVVYGGCIAVIAVGVIVGMILASKSIKRKKMHKLYPTDPRYMKKVKTKKVKKAKKDEDELLEKEDEQIESEEQADIADATEAENSGEENK